MAERTPEELRRILRERTQEINYEEFSEEEPDAEEPFDEVNDIQDVNDAINSDGTPQMEVDDSDLDEPRSGRRRSIIKGENGFKWSLNAPETRGRRSVKIYSPKGNGAAKNVKTPLEAWSLFFPLQLLETIVQHTNEEIRRRNDDQHYSQETNVDEIKALLGILYLCGMEKQNHTCTEDLWAPRYGSNFYRAVMQRHRFHYLLACLRFDDKSTRAERRAVHKLAPIKEIWDIFINNCTANYTPSTYCTIDEQLLNFRGRFGAKVYIPNKPDKYGIKIVAMNDVQTSYLISAEPYVGQVTNLQNGESVPSYYVRKLSESIHHTQRNITCDNWFMSVNLMRTMKNDYDLTVVGTLRKNKREIPISFTRAASAGTARYAYSEKNTLLSYSPKKNKVVLLLSSFHERGRLDNVAQIPEIVTFYNRTKGGTDTFDQMCHAYTTARVTGRWPLRLFFGMLDQAGINSLILYNLRAANKALNRRDFIKELSFALFEPHLRSRLHSRTLRTSLRIVIREILNSEPEYVERTSKMLKRKRCSFCSADKKTTYCCVQCEKPICEEHRFCICIPCFQEM